VFNLFRTHAVGFAVPALNRRVPGNIFHCFMEQSTANAYRRLRNSTRDDPGARRLDTKEDVMLGFRKIVMVVLLIAALSIGPLIPAAFADEYLEREKPTGGMMMWDTLFMRPIGIVATGVGSVFWLVSYPFAALGGNTNESTQELVVAPFEWTFERPLGHF